MKLTKSKKLSAVRVLLCTSGMAVLIATMPEKSFAFDTTVIDWAIYELCDHITGAFGALLTGVAVLGAIVSAAMGSYRVFMGAIIVGIGAFTAPDILEMQFKEAADQCPASPGGRGRSSEMLVQGDAAGQDAAPNHKSAVAVVARKGTQKFSRMPEPAAADAAESDDEDAQSSWSTLEEVKKR